MRTQTSVLEEIETVRARVLALRAANHGLRVCDDVLALLDDAALRVAHAWPLPAEVRARITLGRYAVRNLDDIDASLADACARLDAALRA